MAGREGKVSLVGAGPGDPGLLTLAGKCAIAAADVILYDRLVNEAVLVHAREDAELIRRPPRAGMSQAQINEFLVSRARAGQIVCRLKGGDPFIFGRGGEELEALVEAGIPFEVVPGVSSALAAPAYAGIPLTHREFSSTLGIVTAHEDRDKPESALRWEFLARCVDTGVFLMGMENLEHVVSELLKHGKPEDTPVAVIRWGTTPQQVTVEGTLESIVARCREARMRPPALIVVGKVVKLRERLRWFDVGPLSGKRILVTRAREQAGALVDLLAAKGAEAVLFPTLRFERIGDADLGGLDAGYDWLVFTSANTVRFLLETLNERGQDLRSLGRGKIAAVGAQTRKALEQRGLRVHFVPDRYLGSALAEQFPEVLAGKRVFLPRAEVAPETLPQALREAGAEVDVVPVYRALAITEGADAVREQIESGALDAVTFASSSAARNFRAALPKVDLAGTLLACIGPETAATVRELGLGEPVVAEEHSAAGLVSALKAALSP